MRAAAVLDHSVVGRTSDPDEVRWDERDVMLYALAVGAGQDPATELNLTTENTAGVALRVMPSFALVLTQRSAGRNTIRLGDYDPELLVHAEQQVEVAAPLPVSGAVLVTSTVTGIYDKRSGALAVIESRAVDATTGRPAYTERSSVFIRGAGGFGGPGGPRSEWSRPERAPDASATLTTRPEQALIYRLCADRYPLHSDPAFAARGGFSRPILHGLCTYGFSARAVIAAFGAGNPDRLLAMDGRFTSPVYPGQALTVQMWHTETDILFETSTAPGTPVLSRGRATLRSS